MKYIKGLFIICLATVLMFSSCKNSDNKEVSDYNNRVNLLLDSMTVQRGQNMKNCYVYLDEALNLVDRVDDSTKVKLFVAAGTFFFNNIMYNISLDYYFQALNIQSEIDPQGNYEIYKNIGNAYFRLNEKEKAKEYYLKAKSLAESYSDSNVKKDNAIYSVYNNLALLEHSEKKYKETLRYLTENLKIAERLKDTTILVSTYNNLSNMYYDLGDLEKGQEYRALSEKFLPVIGHCKTSAVVLGSKASTFFDKLNNLDSALYYAKMSYEMGVELNYPYVKIETATLMSSIYLKKNDFENALKYNNIVKQLTDEIAEIENFNKISAIELNAKQQQKILSLELLQENRKKMNYVITALSILLVVIFYLMFRLQRNKAAKRSLESVILHEQLEAKNKEFSSKVLQMLQISKILDNTRKDILSVEVENPSLAKNQLRSIASDLQTERKSLNWNEFDKIFVETNDEFYKSLLDAFPSLTKNELRLCAFLKMNLSTKEIAAITGQSENSLVVARSRLRKKLNISNEKDSINSVLIKY